MLLHKWEESERVIATSKKTGLQITIPIEHQHKLEVYMKHKEKKAGRTGKPGMFVSEIIDIRSMICTNSLKVATHWQTSYIPQLSGLSALDFSLTTPYFWKLQTTRL